MSARVRAHQASLLAMAERSTQASRRASITGGSGRSRRGRPLAPRSAPTMTRAVTPASPDCRRRISSAASISLIYSAGWASTSATRSDVCSAGAAVRPAARTLRSRSSFRCSASWRAARRPCIWRDPRPAWPAMARARRRGRRFATAANAAARVSLSTPVARAAFQQAADCPECGGRGKIIASPCPECQGEGQVHRDEVLRVRIPVGANEGMALRVAGHGLPGPPPGDLIVVVRTAPDPRFRAPRRRPLPRGDDRRRGSGARREPGNADPRWRGFGSCAGGNAAGRGAQAARQGLAAFPRRRARRFVHPAAGSRA